MDSRGIYGYIYIYIIFWPAKKSSLLLEPTWTDHEMTGLGAISGYPQNSQKWAKLPMPHFPFVISSRHCSHMNPTNLGTISDDWAKNLAGAQTQNGYGAFSIHFAMLCDVSLSKNTPKRIGYRAIKVDVLPPIFDHQASFENFLTWGSWISRFGARCVKHRKH